MMTLDIDQIESDLAAGRTDHRTVRQLLDEVKRLQEEIGDLAYASGESADTIFRLENEIERLQDTASPKPGPSTGSGHGFLTWAMQVEDALPPGMAMGVKVDELRRWYEAGMDAKGAALQLRSGCTERIKGDERR